MVALDSEDDAIQRGESAPDFELPAASGGSRSLSDFADREALLVVFTCNHCPYAQAKFDELNRLASEYDDLAVVGINPNDAEEYPDDSYERMQDLVEDGTIRYDAYLRDESQTVAREYGAVCTPDPFLFAVEDGEFPLVYHGRIDDALNPDDEPTEMEMRNIVERLLAGEEIDDEFRPSRGCSIKWTDE
ncbi:thioredoxin family protein [Halorientalis sp. IM1011]|uniref:thioredoxin family protein n=1 Tax=Halorientalis sp. IM1011 TaxID=1932360 RepID=UPI00097CD0BD|nr:thioredoxin family protein [Halorientalis sp. IM1011]AQL41613.1 thioredoxin family protein [Halorientalis sp. IM1011]